MTAVSKETNYFVTNDPNADSKLLRRAREYGVQIIDEKTFDEMVCWRFADASQINIPQWVKIIADHAFKDCRSLTNVTIPNRVKSIGSSAFQGCSSLTSVTIPNSVTTIGNSAFKGCSSLTIHANASSYAIDYAKKNNIKHTAK